MKEKNFKVEELEERLEMAAWDECCNNTSCPCATEPEATVAPGT